MHLNKASVRIVVLAISIPLVVLGTIVSVVGQAPPNLPPPGAYVPIPNFAGVGAGSLFRRAINDRFSGAQRMAPAIATASFANLPGEQDGMLIYCPDCKLTTPCTGTGTGAWALGARGQWTCSSGALEANLNANGNKLTNLASGTVGGDTLVFGQPAGSDLSGSFPNPIVQTVLGGKTPIYSNQASPLLEDSMLPVTGTATKVIVQGAPNLTLNRPSTVVSGHTMIMGYFSTVTAAPTAPSGWTLIRSDTACGIFGTMASYYKVAGGSEPSSYTWTFSSGYHSAALIDVGVTAANPVDVISPAVCASGPTLAGLTLGAQPEKVIIFGGGSNNFLGSATQILFDQGSQFAQITGSGIVPFSGAHLTANYATSPSVTMTIGGGAAQMIAIKPAASYGSSPVLQGDSYAELTKIAATFGSNASIERFNIDGRFNVKNPIYGAKGDGLADDTAAIQAAYNAACAAAIASNTTNANIGATLWFPTGTYLTSFSLISNCSQPITWKCESEGACMIQGQNSSLFPIIMHEAASYLNGITSNGPILAASLATGSGSSLNWGATSQQYYDLKDTVNGLNSTGWANAQPLNGATALSVEGFLNYAGGASGNIYILSSHGDDLSLPNIIGALNIFLVPGSPNKLAACITTSGGITCTGAGGSITAGTTYEFEVSYDGSTLRVFVGTPGNTTTLAASAAATGAIIQQPSEVLALGDGGGFAIGGSISNSNHWIGQLDSIRISNVARHTSTYTAPTAKLTNDGNTQLLMNNLAQSDTLLKVTNVASGFSPVWIPLHQYGSFGTGPTPGNIHANFVNLSFQGGNYNLLGENVLYTTLDHVTGGGASHDAFKFEFISYGTRIEHLTAQPAQFGESGVVLSHVNGLVNLSWLFTTGGYYGMELIDAGGTYSMLFMNPGFNAVADLDIGGSTIFNSTSIHELSVDFESGGTPVPAKIWGVGSVEFYGGNWQYDPSVNAIWANPGGANAGLALSLFGGQVAILGTPANPLISWKGGGSPATPATWINPLVNGKSLSAAGVTLSDNAAYAQALGDVTIPPVKTVATLPTCNSAAKGWQVQISDCNTNCTTYLGTTFTGGGSTRSTVQCNGTGWELH